MLQRICNGSIAKHVQLHLSAIVRTPDQKHNLRAFILKSELDLIELDLIECRVTQLPH